VEHTKDYRKFHLNVVHKGKLIFSERPSGVQSEGISAGALCSSVEKFLRIFVVQYLRLILLDGIVKLVARAPNIWLDCEKLIVNETCISRHNSH
jgi:hypothetical protein